VDRALARLRGLAASLTRDQRTRVICAAAALLGAFVPLVAVTQWPSEIVLFLLLMIGVGVPLTLYVLLIRTLLMSRVAGGALAVCGVVLPMPGYPQFFDGVAGRWGYVLLLLPVVLFAVWLVGWLVDLVVRTDRRLGDRGRPPTPGTGLVLRPTISPVRPGVVRGVASVAAARAALADRPEIPPQPGLAIRVEYRSGEPSAPPPERSVIDGDIIAQTDHPLD
jgi:hypothetical protein